jgi:hypothetical protein
VQDIGNLIALYGLHERIINNMASRFDEGLITDFYEYVQTWLLINIKQLCNFVGPRHSL